MFCHIAEDVSSACWRVLQSRLQADMQALLWLPLLCCTELHPVIVPATSETKLICLSILLFACSLTTGPPQAAAGVG